MRITMARIIAGPFRCICLARIVRWLIHLNATLFGAPAFRPQAQIVCQALLETLAALASAGSPWKLSAFDTTSQDRAA